VTNRAAVLDIERYIAGDLFNYIDMRRNKLEKRGETKNETKERREKRMTKRDE